MRTEEARTSKPAFLIGSAAYINARNWVLPIAILTIILLRIDGIAFASDFSESPAGYESAGLRQPLYELSIGKICDPFQSETPALPPTERLAMAAKKYRLTIKLPSGRHQKIFIEADSPSAAKEMAETQYGKGSVVVSPLRVR